MAEISLSLGVLLSTTSRPTGTIIAPPAPCSTRSQTNSVRLCAIPHSTEASVKIASAAANTRRAPKRCATQPLIGMNTPSVSR